MCGRARGRGDQLGIMFLDAGMDESHHHGKGEVALGLHPVQTTDVVVLEA